MSITTLFKTSDKTWTSRALLSVLLKMKNRTIKENQQKNELDFSKLSTNWNLNFYPEFAFTPSGHFYGGRSKKNLITYSRFIHLEINNLSKNEMNRTIQLAQSNPYTYACFKNPGKNRLFLIAKVDSPLHYHVVAFIKLHNYFKRYLGVRINDADMRITRLCPCIFDREMYINTASIPFPVLGKSRGPKKKFPSSFPIANQKRGKTATNFTSIPFCNN